ncbi:MAG: rod-binding protein [Thermodesulfobacteriota bacterium]
MSINPTRLSSNPSTPPSHPKIDEERLKKACIDFESLFIERIIASMRKTVPESGFLGGGPDHGVFQPLFDQELSRNLATSRGIGLGKMIYEQMMRRFKTPE